MYTFYHFTSKHFIYPHFRNWKRVEALNNSDLRYGFIGIIIEDREAVPELQGCLSEYSDFILGRMGLPHLDHGQLSIITLIVQASTDIVGSFTGRLGNIPGITVKSGLAKLKSPEL